MKPESSPGASVTERETAEVVARYARRETVAHALSRCEVADRYSLLRPDVWHSVHERQRVLFGLLAAHGWHDLAERRLVDVGCGAGAHLLEFLRMGFAPSKLRGIELLPQRHAQARALLPSAVALDLGDARQATVADGSVDLVFQATVFSSLLDNAFQQQLADAMWRWVKPGGAVLWYDFTVNNPANPDVRGVPMHRLRELFPHATIDARRITLAPPIARRVCRLHPALYPLFNALPLLRTHRLVWLGKASTIG